MLIDHKKKFLILGPHNICTTKYFFLFMQKRQLWRGYNSVKKFYRPDETMKDKGTHWYTNLKVNNKNKPKLNLVQKYDPEKYPKYLNYDAIDCKKIMNIPVDYPDEIGTSLGIFDVNYEEYFDLVGMDGTLDKIPFKIIDKQTNSIRDRGTVAARFYLECKDSDSRYTDAKTGKPVKKQFARFVIKRKKDNFSR